MSFRDQASSAKMTSLGGKLTALACHPTIRVNQAEELTYISASIANPIDVFRAKDPIPVVSEVRVVDGLVVVLAGPAVLAGADEDVGQKVDHILSLEVQVAQLALLQSDQKFEKMPNFWKCSQNCSQITKAQIVSQKYLH